MRRKVSFSATALAVCLSATLSGCAVGARQNQVATQNTSSNVCPAQKVEHEHDVDVRLDNLSVKELSALVDAGRADAMVLLALRYGPAPEGDTKDRPLPDMSRAITLLQRAVDQGSADGMYLMATVHINGLGVPKDEAKAAYWFERAASKGHGAAEYWYGQMLAKGRGGKTVDWKAALPYLKKAAEQGYPDAFLELGHMYVNGYGGLEADPHKAAFCFRRIIAQSQLAQYNMRRLIEAEQIVWEPGDPGRPFEKPSSPPAE